MIREREGPDMGAGDRHSRPPATSPFHKAHSASHHTSGAQPCYRYAEGLRRRRAAADKLPSLDCGCRDPWPCKCTEPPLSERMVDGWRDAAEHVVLATGLIPLVPLEVRRALWRRGGADRALAQRLHDACGGVAA